MARIQIIYSGVVSANRILQKAIEDLGEIEDTYHALKNHVSPDVQSRYQIAEQFRDCCQSAEAVHCMAENILKVAKYGLLEYRNTEKRLRQAVPTDHDIFETR